MKSYSITNWNEEYENNRSRLVDSLAWVPVPNRHDGEGFSRIMADPKAAEIFSAWILVLQVASQSKRPRGALLRSSGEPHTAESLALKTRGKKSWFEAAFPVLLEVGWLTISEVAINQQHGTCLPGLDADVTPPCHKVTTSGNGMEEKGIELTAPASPVPVAPKTEREQNPIFNALAAACGRDPKQMTAPDARACGVALANIKRVCPDLTEAEIKRRAENYRQHFQSAALTPSALCAHWATSDKPPTYSHANNRPNSRTIAATARAVSAYAGIENH